MRPSLKNKFALENVLFHFTPGQKTKQKNPKTKQNAVKCRKVKLTHKILALIILKFKPETGQMTFLLHREGATSASNLAGNDSPSSVCVMTPFGSLRIT